MKYYRVYWNVTAFVKTEAFFREQGGLELEWGKYWKRIRARSIEHARKICQKTMGTYHRGRP